MVLISHIFNLEKASLVSFLEEIEPTNRFIPARRLSAAELVWLQRNAVDALALALVSHVRIDLSGLHVLVSEHVLDGVNARTCINLQGTELLLSGKTQNSTKP